MSHSDGKEHERSVGDGATRVPGATGIAELTGHKFGLYTLEELLAEGGQGAVYRARDGLGKLRAVKVVPRQALAGAEERLVRESDALESLRHPNVVAFHACDVEGDYAWLAMQYVDGESAGQCVRHGGPLAETDAVGILEDVLRGLAAAHAAGIVHRDLSANNVLIQNGSGRALLTDFGLARGDQLGHSLTATGAVVGTGAYIAPEVFEGEQAGPAADLWAVGVLACHLVTGTAPFEARSWVAMMRAVCDKRPDLSRIDASPRLLPLVKACLEKDPDRRVQSAELALELLRGERPPIESSKPSRSAPPRSARAVAEPRGNPEAATVAAPPRWVLANVLGWFALAAATSVVDLSTDFGAYLGIVAVPLVVGASQLIGGLWRLGARWGTAFLIATPAGWASGVWLADTIDAQLRYSDLDRLLQTAMLCLLLGATMGLAQAVATVGRLGATWFLGMAFGIGGAMLLTMAFDPSRDWIDYLKEHFWWLGPAGGAWLGLATWWGFSRFARR